MPDYPPIDHLRNMPPIEDRTDEEWEDYARFIIAESSVLDGDVEAMALALKSSAQRERELRRGYLQGWAAIESEAFAMHESYMKPDPVVDDSPAEFDEPTTLEPLALEAAESEVAEVIRVHELANQLGIDSAELLAKLAEYGSTITSASANVDHDTAQIMRGIYAEGES